MGQIIATPEYAQTQLSPDNHFLILASDGLWDVIESKDTVIMVNNALRKKVSLNAIAKMLQDTAIQRDSADNITVCVVAFDWNQKVITETNSGIKRWWNWLWGK